MTDISSRHTSDNPATSNAPLSITYFERKTQEVGQRRDIKWSALCEWIARNAPTAATKDGLPLIKLGTFAGNHRTNINLEAVFGVEGDYDSERVQPADAARILTAFGVQAFIYTSPSHRPDAPRWRVLLPLSRPHTPNDRHALLGRANGLLGCILAQESFVPAQSYYVGSVTNGEPVQCWKIEGRPLDTFEGLPIVAPPPSAPMTGYIPIGQGERAPSFDAAVAGLQEIDVRQLTERADWMAITGAFMQSIPPERINDALPIWLAWNEPYPGNDSSKNLKDWNDTLKRGTIVKGWPRLHREAYGEPLPPQRDPMSLFGGATYELPAGTSSTPLQPAASPQFGELLTPQEQQHWFRECVLIGPENRIIDAKGQEYDVGAFNSTYGGKRFIIDAIGKQTDEAWKAATRSTLWTVPKVDGTSFRPDLATGTITTDELGRRSVNVYIPAKIDRAEGDASPFLNHLTALIPNPDDQRILLAYMAHNAKYPGHKIPWAPLIQSTEGAGKNVIKYAMTHVMGDHYTYPPNPKELATGGGKFNDWMHRKLFLIADEIKTDDKRDLVEVLKPMISETKLEMQKKGRDQRKADNPANWFFFSNFKDAIPVHTNGRRFAIFYSAIQTVDDLKARGMGDTYFNSLYGWLGDDQNGGHKTGLKIVANYLLNYPIERGSVPKRAPQTTSTAEALIESRGWLETMIAEAVDDLRNGFRSGWINTAALASYMREQRKDAKTRTVGEALKALGYHRIGQAGRGYFQDDATNPNRRGWLWNTDPLANVANYGRTQNYE